MLKDSLEAIGTAARALWRNRGALAIFNALYAALLITLYLFVATTEARVWKLVLSALLVVIAPVLFFLIQAAGVRYVRGEMAVGALARQALRDFWKIFLVSLPFIALGVLLAYLLDKLQLRFPIAEAAEPARITAANPLNTPPPLPLHWQNVVFTGLRFVALGVVVPLAAIHFWIALAHRGFKVTLKKSPRILAGAFAPRSILIYGVGLFVFAVVPYFLIFTRTSVTNGWLELIIFGLRLALAFVFTLWGWVITLGALANITGDTEARSPAAAATTATPVEATRASTSAPTPVQEAH